MPGEKTSSDSEESSANSKQSNGNLNNYKRIFAYSDSLSWALNGIALITAAASGTVLPLMDVIFGKFITVFNSFASGATSPEDFRSELGYWTLWFIYLFVAKFVLVYVWTLTLSIAATRITKALRIHFLERTLRQDIAFFDTQDMGSTAALVSTNGNLVNQGISEKLGQVIQAISSFFTAIVVAVVIQWKLALITFSIVPTIMLVIGVCSTFESALEAKLLNIYSNAGKLAEDVFGGISTVHAFWAHSKVAEKFEAFLIQAKKVGMKKSPVYAGFFCIEYFSIYSGYALAFWQGVRMYARGEISEPGDIVTVVFAIIVAATAMGNAAPSILLAARASSAASDLFKVIDREPDIDILNESGGQPDECMGDIEIKDVEFAYPARPDIQILKGFNLAVPAKKTVAIVGPSGCGKSTIVGLLERWYNPNCGTVTLDGIAINKLNLRWLRTNVRLVEQEPTLFNGTVMENVSAGLLGTSLAKCSEHERRKLVEEACVAAYADEFIRELPHGFDTQIGERGSRISGGQKQRIAIARAIVSNPKVLLLDEATSALDPKAECIVQAALENVAQNRSTVVIAHKLSTVRRANKIAVMSEGRIIEEGSHEELVKLDGTYSRLVSEQQLGHDPDDAEGDAEEMLEDDTREKLELSMTRSKSFRNQIDMEGDERASLNYGLLKCLWILFGEQREVAPHLLLTLVVCFVGGLTFPALALVFSQAMNVLQLEPRRMVERGDFFALMFFVIALANLFAYSTMGWVANMASQHITYKYRMEMFNNITKQDNAFFDKPSNTIGALVSRLSTHPNSLMELLSYNVAIIIIIIINLGASCILAVVVGWKLGLVVIFGALVPLVLCGYIRIRLEFRLEDAIEQRFADSASLAGEAISAIRTVASLTLERHMLEKYRSQLRGINKTSIKYLGPTMVLYALTQSISFLAMALGFWYGGRLLSTGEYSTAQFYIVFISVIFSGEAAAQFFSYSTSISKAHGAANYMLWLRSLVPTMREHDKPKDDDSNDDKVLNQDTHLSCDKVKFTYPRRPDALVLRGIDIDIPPGQFIAFVGPSGCGKTTLISLLSRLYDPTSGHIRLNSRAISDLCPRRYRRLLSLVPQTPTLFPGTIRDNISLGLDTADESHVSLTDAELDSRIMAATDAAHLSTFISSLPSGLHTPCGARGTHLSGGQRQRVALARALVRNPRVLLLDEATSALDTETEAGVRQAVIETGERTTVAVAHRLSTVRTAGCICVVVKGRIVEIGTHEELRARRGVYWRMCLGQALDG